MQCFGSAECQKKKKPLSWLIENERIVWNELEGREQAFYWSKTHQKQKMIHGFNGLCSSSSGEASKGMFRTLSPNPVDDSNSNWLQGLDKSPQLSSFGFAADKK